MTIETFNAAKPIVKSIENFQDKKSELLATASTLLLLSADGRKQTPVIIPAELIDNPQTVNENIQNLAFTFRQSLIQLLDDKITVLTAELAETKDTDKERVQPQEEERL